MLKIVEHNWLMNLRGTGYHFDKTNDYKRMKRNNDGKCVFFDNAMKNCNVKIIDNIFFEGEPFPLRTNFQKKKRQ